MLAHKIKWLILIMFCFQLSEAQITVKSAEGTLNKTANKLQKRASEEVREEISGQQTSIRNKARTTVQDMKRLPSRSLSKGNFNENPSLEELIKDAEVKKRLRDRENKVRFVDLFAQWLMLPNETQIKAEIEYQRLIDSMKRIDSSKYRFPKKVTEDQFVTIFGWHPHFNGKAYKAYNYSLLSAISYYSYDIDPYTGNCMDSFIVSDFLGAGDPSSGIVATAHEQDCKVLLSITSHSEDNNSIFLEPMNVLARQQLIDQLIYILDSAKADGVEINFEQIPPIFRDEFYKFVKKLSFSLRKANSNYTICLSVPPYDPASVFNLAKMQQDVDFFIIKGFDFQKDPKEPTGLVKKAVSPLNYSPASAEEDLRSVVERYIASIGSFYAHRLILSLGNYGSLWKTTDRGHELSAYVPYNEIQYNYRMKDSLNQIRIDSNYFVYVWQKFDTINMGRSVIMNELLFDDIETFRTKFQFLQSYGLGGVGIWPLGYDEGFDQLWDLIEEEFTTINIPPVQGLEQITAVSKKARSWSPVILTILLFVFIFSAAGFLMAIFDIDVRRSLFNHFYFRMIFLVVFAVLFAILSSFFGLFEGRATMMLTGLLLGAFLSYGTIMLVQKYKSKAP